MIKPESKFLNTFKVSGYWITILRTATVITHTKPSKSIKYKYYVNGKAKLKTRPRSDIGKDFF